MDAIAFVRRGVFERRIGSQRTVGAANHALYYPRGVTHRTRHPVGGGDSCTVLCVDRPLLEEIRLQVSEGRVGDGDDLPTRARPLPGSVYLAQWRALRRCSGGVVDAIEAHERMLALATAAVRALIDGGAPGSRAVRGDTRSAHRDLAHETALLLAGRLEERWTLDDLAEEVCSSPYHLARVFKREMGQPIHRWLLRLRLREAVDRLAAGADDLTALALDLGFASRGHLSDAFRAEYGEAPSAVRRALRIDAEICN